MSEPPRPKIRKACDLCYRKRIKCDGQTPRCSACQVYGSQCTHQAPSRQKRSAKSRQAQSSNPPTSVVNTESNTISSGSHVGIPENVDHSHLDIPRFAIARQLEWPPEITVGPSTSTTNLNFGLFLNTEQSGHDVSSSMQMELPPEGFVRQLVDTYLANINCVFPLFDPQQLGRTVDQWYEIPSRRSRITFAVINVVMAIAQYHGSVQAGFGHTDVSVGSVQDCLSKAQSALTEILMGDVELANLQVLLGLVMIFQSTSDIKPAVFLLSTALRLAQVLGIHRSDSEFYRNSTPREALQRRRVFWVAYILDRDIAVRIRQVPIQQDSDISIELPPEQPDADFAGFVDSSGDHQHGFNIFRAQAELSQIQGHIYESLFSVRSQQLSAGEKAASRQAIRLLIKEWKGRIPATLSAEALSQTRGLLSYIPRVFCKLYGSVITCLGLLCEVHSMDFRWIDQLRSHARSLTVGMGETSLPPPQPQGWNALVNMCREFMPLFTSIQNKGPAFIWMNVCPYSSALVCLSANSVVDFDNRDSLEDLDRRLKVDAVSFLSDLHRQTNHKTLTRVLEAFTELDSQRRFMSLTSS